jgi:hypothetical protein
MDWKDEILQREYESTLAKALSPPELSDATVSIHAYNAVLASYSYIDQECVKLRAELRRANRAFWWTWAGLMVALLALIITWGTRP